MVLVVLETVLLEVVASLLVLGLALRRTLWCAGARGGGSWDGTVSLLKSFGPSFSAFVEGGEAASLGRRWSWHRLLLGKGRWLCARLEDRSLLPLVHAGPGVTLAQRRKKTLGPRAPELLGTGPLEQIPLVASFSKPRSLPGSLLFLELCVVDVL